MKIELNPPPPKQDQRDVSGVYCNGNLYHAGIKLGGYLGEIVTLGTKILP